VYPELALTTFFPRYAIDEQTEIDRFFEHEMPNADVGPLFDAASKYGIAFYLGYAEAVQGDGRTQKFNTSILVDATGAVIGKYRKIHLPGTARVEPLLRVQHLEKRYFETGDLGFRVWRTLGGVFGMCICNDRRWPETYRVMGLQGVEMVLLGYNTPAENLYAQQPGHLTMFHNLLTMQAGAYQNSTWVVGVAKAGDEDGHHLIGGSAIIAPSGEIVAQARTVADELIVAECDLNAAAFGKATIFNFGEHRRIEHYTLITSRTGAVSPPK
jgi:predicted amidohydrolase